MVNAEQTEKTRRAIYRDLRRQLKANGTTSRYYLNLVDDYMQLWDIKNALFDDVSYRGVVIGYDNGGGQSGTKQNDSILSVIKVSDRMTKILKELGIKPSLVAAAEDDDDL